MQITHTTFTVAEYCDQMKAGSISVNRDYQRSNKVWPPAARSFLIDTILSGFPMPKFSLFQKTDVKTRRTVKEIVDGQQRSQAIYDFYRGKLRLTGRTEWAGHTYSSLSAEEQQKFLDYPVTVDLIVGSTDRQMREMFRRINSYTAPLNPQEERHAGYLGSFKWFIVDLTRDYAETLKAVGVYGERQLSRMRDGELFTAISRAFSSGIETHAKAKLTAMYNEFDEAFPDEAEYRERFERLFEVVLQMPDIHETALMKPYNFYALALAVTHFERSLDGFGAVGEAPGELIDVAASAAGLGELCDALEIEPFPAKFKTFVEAASGGTNTLKTRTVRARFMFEALVPAE